MTSINTDELNYLQLAKRIADTGTPISQRNGTRYTLANQTLTFDLSNQTLPLITTRAIDYRAIKAELFWFISGSNNVKDLKQIASSIGAKGSFWDSWALTPSEILNTGLDTDQIGSIGNIYSKAWTESYSDGSNQLIRLVEHMRSKPYDTQHILTSYVHTRKYNPKLNRVENIQAGNGSLSPCHGIHVQSTIIPTDTGIDELHLLLTCRSQDYLVGTVFNIAMYATLAHMLSKCLPNTQAASLTWIGANTHIYENQLQALQVQLQNQPNPFPQLAFTNKDYQYLSDFSIHDIQLVNYKPQAFNAKYPISE